MSRPTDWDPIATSDPTPGDTYEIGVMGKHYTDVANEIQQQVTQLRNVANDNFWMSAAGSSFQSTASSCADELDKTHRRYAAVGGALTTWSANLGEHQAAADALLSQAAPLAGQKQRLNEPQARPANPTPAQATQFAADDKATSDALNGVNGQINDLIGQLKKVTDARDGDANHAADLINDAIDGDNLKDSWWDDFKSWVDRNSRWIADAANALGWIATALAVAALIVGTGGAALIIIAAALTVGSLVAHTALAASGDGSWVDVGLDVVSLATLGVGGLGAHAAEEVTETGITKAGDAAAQHAIDHIGEDDAGQLAAKQTASRTANSARASALDKTMARQAQAAAARKALLKPIADRAAVTSSKATAEEAGNLEKFMTGFDKVTAANHTAGNLANSAYGKIPGVASAAGDISKAMRPATLAMQTNVTEDMIRHLNDVSGYAGTIPNVPGGTFIPEVEHEVGSTHSHAE